MPLYVVSLGAKANDVIPFFSGSCFFAAIVGIESSLLKHFLTGTTQPKKDRNLWRYA